MRDDLYRATVIVTGTDLRSRPAGFARAFVAVLVRVTGEPRLASDPRTAALAARAEGLVLSFNYFDPIAARRPHDDQGTYDRSYDLTVYFDPSRIDETARSLGSHPWAGPRPSVIPVVAVRGSDPPWVGSFMLTADNPAAGPQREALRNAARRYGLEVRLPTAAGLEAEGVRFDGPLPERAAAGQGEISLVGSIDYRPAAFGWVGVWHISHGALDRSGQVTGVSFDDIFDRMLRQAVTLASGHEGDG